MRPRGGHAARRDRGGRRHRSRPRQSEASLYETADRLRSQAGPGKDIPRCDPRIAVCRCSGRSRHMTDPIDAISVNNLSKTFGGEWSLFGGRSHEIRAVKEVTLALKDRKSVVKRKQG